MSIAKTNFCRSPQAPKPSETFDAVEVVVLLPCLSIPANVPGIDLSH